MEPGSFWIAFGLTLFAGLSTGIGSALAFFTKSTSTRFLSISLGFSAGVMVYVSFMEILQKARDAFMIDLSEKTATWYTILSFFAGILIIAVIDRMIPSYENPHEIRRVEDVMANGRKDPKLVRMGLFTALAIGIHNFPEGIATFMAGLSDTTIAIPIAVAIAMLSFPGAVLPIALAYAIQVPLAAIIMKILVYLDEKRTSIVLDVPEEGTQMAVEKIRS